MKSKFFLLLIIISLGVTSLYGIDKATNQNPPDSASIRIGLSNIDSSGCTACLVGGEEYDSGCKKCSQDGVLFSINTLHENPYAIAWSNDNSMYHGDAECVGIKKFPNLTSKTGDKYWVELTKIGTQLNSTIFFDEDFSQVVDTVSIDMCSEPVGLKYFRISNEDGKDHGYGGQILASLDDISLYEINSNFQNDVSLNEKQHVLLKEDFENCISKSCNDKWILQDPNMLYVDVEQNYFHIDSQVTNSNDYAHYDLIEFVPDSWNLRFKLDIEKLDAHPNGKGILQLEPNMRQIFLGIPVIVLSPIVLLYLKNHHNKKISLLVMSNGVMIFSGIIFNGLITNQFNSIEFIYSLSGLSIFYGIIISYLGLFSFFRN